jgi:hypothetical protein
MATQFETFETRNAVFNDKHHSGNEAGKRIRNKTPRFALNHAEKGS